MQAYDLYLRGRHATRTFGRGNAEEALALFRKATERDPNFAPAWAALGQEVIALRETQFWDGIPEAEAVREAQASMYCVPAPPWCFGPLNRPFDATSSVSYIHRNSGEKTKIT